jgi:CHASE2 domain-containing sensor protein
MGSSVVAILVVSWMVLVAVLFVAWASRSGTGRMLAAMAVSIAWFALTAAIFRSESHFDELRAARNYALVMAIVLVAYFGITRRRRKERGSNSNL